jgi:hypothetical protein
MSKYNIMPIKVTYELFNCAYKGLHELSLCFKAFLTFFHSDLICTLNTFHAAKLYTFGHTTS